MTKYAYDFIEIAERASKPRDRGLTFVRDPGTGLTAQRIFLESAGEFVDYVKFRNVVPRLFRESLIKEKIALYKQNGVRVMSGGIFFQFAWRQQRLDRYFSYLVEIGFDAAEVGYSMLDVPKKDKLDAIAKLRSLGIEVIYEWGKKFPGVPLEVEGSARELEELLKAGVSRIVIEGGEIQLLLDAQDRDKAAQRLVDLVNRIGADKIIFEVDNEAHIAWVLKKFGPDANIGPNISPEQVLWLEPMRRGLGKAVKYSVFENT
ncbi:MAG: phosphosulfolactate synthase [Betaproteobacteria bacterium]|nr:phosphosulfolactate synthase [Betaproteobacteria bacterium]